MLNFQWLWRGIFTVSPWMVRAPSILPFWPQILSLTKELSQKTKKNYVLRKMLSISSILNLSLPLFMGWILNLIMAPYVFLTLKRRGGGGIRPQAGSSLCCAETVSSRKLKLCDFYYIPISLISEYKPVPWDIHCCHGNAIVEGCSVKFWLKSVENCYFCSNRFLISI